MNHLDCETQDSTYDSLARALGVPRHGMDAAFRAMPPLADGAAADESELWDRLKCGTTPAGAAAGVDAVCWFHLTRLPDPKSVRRLGVLPLNLALDSIWDFLHGLLPSPSSRPEWDAFRARLDTRDDRRTRLYRAKVRNPLHWGPYAILMREAAARPKEMGCHDYLRTPEIVEDICRAYALESGVDLAPAYRAATRPCVVKFSVNVR